MRQLDDVSVQNSLLDDTGRHALWRTGLTKRKPSPAIALSLGRPRDAARARVDETAYPLASQHPGGRGLLRRSDVVPRLGEEQVAAGRRAEAVQLALVLGAERLRPHAHPADRVAPAHAGVGDARG